MASADPALASEPKRTALHAAHLALGARMVGFAGYDMPVQYPDGILKEHAWTRGRAGLFDVSHMGPATLALERRSGDPDRDHAAVSRVLQRLVCGDIESLRPGRLRYTLMLNDEGGILDDLIVGRPSAPERQGELWLVVNARTKDADFARIGEAAAGTAVLIRRDDDALLALQGPEAEAVLADLLPGCRRLAFMSFEPLALEDESLLVSRSGYTGEDGFEILAPRAVAGELWRRLLSDDRVRPAGLGARDSLRLEAGLPLYGHDLDETTSPVEAALAFAVSRRRLQAGDLPGAARILRELTNGPSRVRVGLLVEGAPAREGAEVLTPEGAAAGRITSGGFSPTLGRPIAMACVDAAHAAPGTSLRALVRGRAQAADVTALPFVPHRYRRKP